jgi:hypothetical protein
MSQIVLNPPFICCNRFLIEFHITINHMRYLKSNNLFVECFIKCFDVINGVKFIDGGLPLDQARIFKELEGEYLVKAVVSRLESG